MLETIAISSEKIIHQIKLSCQIPSVVENIINCKIITRATAEAGIKANSEELQQAADSWRLMNNLRSADTTWSWLQKYSLSLDDLEELVEATVISTKLAQHLFADKVEPYFVEHQLDYASVVMYEVVLEDEDLAMELFYAIREGEISFYEVAHQYIQNAELRRCGGYPGILNRTALKPEISAAVFAASPPQLIKPILTSAGAHLILVEEIIQPKLDNILQQKIILDLFSEWLKQQAERFEFEINLASKGLESCDSKSQLQTVLS